MNTKMKRHLAPAVAGVSAIALLAGCASGTPEAQTVDLGDGPPVAGTVKEGALEGVTLTFTSYGGVFQEGQMAALEGFSDTSGARILEDGPTEYAKIKAMVDAQNVTWEIVDIDSNWGIQQCGVLLEPIDTDIVDLSSVPDGLTSECFVPAMQYANVLVYNTESFSKPLTSWDDFFNTADFPGKRSVQGEGDIIPGILEGALIADGVAPEDLYPLDIDRALSKLDTIRDELIFWSTGAQQQQIMESGEAEIGLMWTGRAYSAVEAGAPLAASWATGFPVMDVLSVPKSTKNKDAAMALLNFYLGAEQQARMTEVTSYSPVNINAEPQLTDLQNDFLTSRPEIAEQLIQPDLDFWAENKDEILTQWTNWVLGV